MREGVVAVVEREGRYLVIRRAAGIPAPNMWCFVGGGLEVGERQEDALIREFREEVGGHVTPLKKIWETVSADGGLRLHWWRARLEPGELAANMAEVSELAWYTLEEIGLLPDLLESNSALVREMQRSQQPGNPG